MTLWTFESAGGRLRLTRLEAFEGSDNVRMDVVAEQPWGALMQFLTAYAAAPAEVAWEAALARQRREQDQRR